MQHAALKMYLEILPLFSLKGTIVHNIEMYREYVTIIL